MSDYIPTLEEIRWCYAASCDVPGTEGYARVEKQFDKWFASTLREAEYMGYLRSLVGRPSKEDSILAAEIQGRLEIPE